MKNIARSLLAVTFILAATFPASAKPWYRYTPLPAAAHSVKCMAMPWKDWHCTAMHYAILGADLLDYRATQYALHNCASCTEYNPLLGKRPSNARLYGEGIGLSLFTEHAFAQKFYDKKPAYGIAAMMVPLGLHGFMAVRQYGITTDDTIRARLGCPACTVTR